MPFSVLDPDCCRRRRERLLEIMQSQRLDLAIVMQPAHVQWLTGVRFPATLQSAAAVRSDGTTFLVHPATCVPEQPAADHVIPYDAQHLFTLRPDQREACGERLFDALQSAGSLGSRVGVEASTVGSHLDSRLADLERVDIEAELWRLRRDKLEDELKLMARATEATASMYRRAREIIRPGVSEITVFNELQSAAVAELGEMLTATGNDYQSNSGGGPPRDRRAQAGELYVLDLGPAYRGYFADNCRTISVDGQPTDLQLAAWERIVGVFDIVTRQVRPGARCRELFDEVHSHLDEFLPGGFPHHLGHGVGLFPHEPPYLNPHWDDAFQLGDVFTVEAGLYAAELKAGIRIENNYRVTQSGVELLAPMPLELA